MNAAVDRLTQASHKLAEAMYKSSSQPGRVRRRAAMALDRGLGRPRTAAARKTMSWMRSS